ncbi:antibiotic biosynthesis monooxygenase [Nonomuraea sp. 3-1Str]|uniref:antibiotic biosynthesis monooxygenase family protein n=1 Tax=Nonomuraea sp. 3-1Str TaxID=2929801 RepID=UPI002866C600|nr:antibiotic biosynthesis monooxygenase family protein [Nonomuraea sp. 3-1Str]MDR8407935.1 antibiotic biosynthesis monooxygenase [Nonomuraea sp. 3-1Str]
MMEVPITRTETPVDEPITMINAFTVPIEESEAFLPLWEENAEIMARQPGFIRARLHRSMIDDAELRFVNVAQWESGRQLEEALSRPEWHESAQRLLNDPGLHITTRPSIYEVVVDLLPSHDGSGEPATR